MAIAFDSASYGGTSFPYTVGAGSNLIVWGFVVGDYQSGAGGTVTGLKYGTTSMTLAGTAYYPNNNTTRWLYAYYLCGPAAGSQTVQIQGGGWDYADLSVLSYTGASQTGQPDAYQGGTTATIGANTNFSDSLTTVADGCWTIFAINNTTYVQSSPNYQAQSIVATAGTVRLNSGTSYYGGKVIDSNAPVSPAGNSTLTAQSTFAGNLNWAGIMVSFAPATATGPTSITMPSYGQLWPFSTSNNQYSLPNHGQLFPLP